MDQDLDCSRCRVVWQDILQVGDIRLPASQIIELLGDHLTDERRARLDVVVPQRSRRFASVLENIYDRGNVSAAMRSSEAFGFIEMALVDAPGAKFKAANRVTRGAEKWLDIRAEKSARGCVEGLQARGYQVWATDLGTNHSIDDLDWSKPTAVVLGNEKDGISEEMREAVDGRFRIPMLGFSQSFNISVAAALIFYRAQLEMRRFGEKVLLDDRERTQLLANYYLRCFDNPEALLKAKLERGHGQG